MVIQGYSSQVTSKKNADQMVLDLLYLHCLGLFVPKINENGITFWNHFPCYLFNPEDLVFDRSDLLEVVCPKLRQLVNDFLFFIENHV